jgi:ABC-2 type transport system permease protein
MNALNRLTYVELKLLLRDAGALIPTLAIPLFVLVVFGLSFKAEGSQLPSMAVAIALALNALYVVPTYLGTYREQGILRRLSTTPMHPATLLAAQLIIHLLGALAATALLIAAAAIMGIAPPGHAAGALAVFALGTTTMFAIGVLIAALAPSGRAASGFGALLYWPLAFLGGVTVPREQMPPVLARIGDFTPLGAFRQAVQETWAGSPPPPLNMAIMAAYALVVGLAAVKFFRWD